MKVKITEAKVLHGKAAYMKDDEVTVDDVVGKHFVDHGWATSDEYTTDKIIDDGPVSLEIHNSVLGLTDTAVA